MERRGGRGREEGGGEEGKEGVSERENEREKERDHCEKNTSIGCLSHAPPLGPGIEPETQARALDQNQTHDLLVLSNILTAEPHQSEAEIQFQKGKEVL